MSQVDDAIRRALSPEDMRTLDALAREEPILVQALKAFEHQERWVSIVGWLGGFGLFAAAAFCAWQVMSTDDLTAIVRWALGAALAFSGVGMIKLWFFMEMQKNSILREVKRLELFLASAQPRA